MLLNALAGDIDPALAERLARRPKRMRGLEARGWAEERGDGTWVLTDEGRAAKERLGAAVDGIRSRVEVLEKGMPDRFQDFFPQASQNKGDASPLTSETAQEKDTTLSKPIYVGLLVL